MCSNSGQYAARLSAIDRPTSAHRRRAPLQGGSPTLVGARDRFEHGRDQEPRERFGDGTAMSALTERKLLWFGCDSVDWLGWGSLHALSLVQRRGL